MLKEVEGGVAEFEPLIRYHSFADSSINFNVVLRAKHFTDQFLLRHEFIKRLHARYEQEGITIPFPIRTIAPRKGEGIEIVTRDAGGAGAGGAGGATGSQGGPSSPPPIQSR